MTVTDIPIGERAPAATTDPADTTTTTAPAAAATTVPVAPAIELSGVTVEFADGRGGTNTVLRDLDLTVAAGELLVVVGKSGGGKTTVLNVVAGLVEPTAGTVRVLGTDPVAARRSTGFMFARDALLPWRNAARNVEYPLELRGVRRAQRRATARRYLELVGLGDAGRLWPWQLSQGMRQRVALARTWAPDPDLLLMDEPFAALDAQTRERVQRAFVGLLAAEHPRTVLFVTHDLEEALVIGDRVLVVGDGRVLADEHVPFPKPRDPFALAADPDFRALINRLHTLLA